MKHVLIILMLILSTIAQAQSHYSKVKTRISDDNQTLMIQIDVTKHGRDIHFKQAFDVSNLNGLQIDLLKYRVFASQGLIVPIHEMKRLMSAGVGVIMLIGLAIAFLIVRKQTKKGPQPNSEKQLQIT
ncbi:hypothetical protein GO730_11045 [Spirosoma sp. HMF3257]|uniref:LPXTG cell wall anchor domain-containing protein n=1 Tax=Spirosoma telluris TaxID=2183553 RepID=A0A327NHK5_9BACT|nr:hypothetical protein [Spirosoma telluris]RAI74657.1 hypothetical protein HMF3257_10965 [Spirosoma telluris]